mgnify:CR=1 FL=1
MTIISDDAFVRLCQARYGLKQDGIAGAVTIGRLGLKAPRRLPVDDDTFVRLFQGKHGLKIDGWSGRDTIAMLDSMKPPVIDPSDATLLEGLEAPVGRPGLLERPGDVPLLELGLGL